MNNDSTLTKARLPTLPYVITQKNKAWFFLACYPFFIAFYLIANHFHLMPPQELPTTWLDRSVPFMPNTIWIYLSEYVFFIAVFVNAKDIQNMNRYFYSLVGLQAISLTVFMVWPTTFPRENFPLPDDLNALSHFAFSTQRLIDSPASCFPSLHVGCVFVSSFIFMNEQKKKFPFFLFWSSLIAASTLTTKQHYAVDIAGGLFVAIAMFWLFHRAFSYREVR